MARHQVLEFNAQPVTDLPHFPSCTEDSVLHTHPLCMSTSKHIKSLVQSKRPVLFIQDSLRAAGLEAFKSHCMVEEYEDKTSSTVGHLSEEMLDREMKEKSLRMHITVVKEGSLD